ncbi:hypothetical protein GLOTRDRAFT_74212 [Gloeophyllum trabeum ATCC 11539]|uniref:DBF4-type domain-containing protein n=1 Tax=Gloeophyllum trabeum (strain ATCC 11539 / FP-39264 / Madison 617) TaxID=670483 RepID=S7RVW7_GLOTA|nr:uncharacterized protein GLOTRDRAFT_74212 [Gloeophyllum trabeum ATCC 11539]EPQ57429.1 hypothetical protein GLOTRDRAFT_74212 [Gloeophyllum trabeum ATCC 11539]
MATVRRPLLSRPLPGVVDPGRLLKGGLPVGKRARSPDAAFDAGAVKDSAKRARALPPVPVQDEERKEKEQRRLEREKQKRDFQIKYTKAFPQWSFYFDLDVLNPEEAATQERLTAKIEQLGGRVEDFFSNDVTHLVTNKPIPPPGDRANKENSNPKVVLKAVDFGIKIWDTVKLQSVLERCLAPLASSTTASRPQLLQPATGMSRTGRDLQRLLLTERLRGTTTERDPTQKRHNYQYFSKSSYFLLVEDMKQELATIHALEYTISKGKDGVERGAWPILYCHPRARGPFVEYNEKEQRRWEKAQLAEKEDAKERECVKAKLRRERKKEQMQVQPRQGDLRRTVSMNNLHRRVTNPELGFDELLDWKGDNSGSVNASGYLASTGAYIAASGNSVNITSTAGTTSMASGPLQTLQLPAALRDRLEQQVTTSRRVTAANNGNTADANGKLGDMGPPLSIPERRAQLKKSRSTSTLRLPKRDEKSKPGYCESCRVKFEDFKEHIKGRKHQKFAMNDDNFYQLDRVLSRVRRRTLQEVEEQRAMREQQRLRYDEDTFMPGPSSQDEAMIDLDADSDEEDAQQYGRSYEVEDFNV